MRRWERPPPAVVVVPENSPEGPALRGQDPPLAVDTPPPVLPAFPLGRLEGAGRPGRTVSKGWRSSGCLTLWGLIFLKRIHRICFFPVDWEACYFVCVLSSGFLLAVSLRAGTSLVSTPDPPPVPRAHRFPWDRGALEEGRALGSPLFPHQEPERQLRRERRNLQKTLQKLYQKRLRKETRNEGSLAGRGPEQGRAKLPCPPGARPPGSEAKTVMSKLKGQLEEIRSKCSSSDWSGSTYWRVSLNFCTSPSEGLTLARLSPVKALEVSPCESLPDFWEANPGVRGSVTGQQVNQTAVTCCPRSGMWRAGMIVKSQPPLAIRRTSAPGQPRPSSSTTWARTRWGEQRMAWAHLDPRCSPGRGRKEAGLGVPVPRRPLQTEGERKSRNRCPRGWKGQERLRLPSSEKGLHNFFF